MGVINLLDIPKPSAHHSDMSVAPCVTLVRRSHPVRVAYHNITLERLSSLHVSLRTGVATLMGNVKVSELQMVPVGSILPPVLLQLQELLDLDYIEQLGCLLHQVTLKAIFVVPGYKKPFLPNRFELCEPVQHAIDFILKVVPSVGILVVARNRVEIPEVAENNDLARFERPSGF